MNLLIEHADLKPRTVGISSILDQRTKQVAEMITHWDPKLEDEIVADNFLLDKSKEDWITLSKEVLGRFIFHESQALEPLALLLHVFVSARL